MGFPSPVIDLGRWQIEYSNAFSEAAKSLSKNFAYQLKDHVRDRNPRQFHRNPLLSCLFQRVLLKCIRCSSEFKLGLLKSALFPVRKPTIRDPSPASEKNLVQARNTLRRVFPVMDALVWMLDPAKPTALRFCPRFCLLRPKTVGSIRSR